MRDVDWDHELGSNLLDMALARHFTAEFAAKHKLDLDSILGNAKVMAKMKKQVGIRILGGGSGFQGTPQHFVLFTHHLSASLPHLP